MMPLAAAASEGTFRLAALAGGGRALALAGGLLAAAALAFGGPWASPALSYAGCFVYGPLLCLGLAAAYSWLAARTEKEPAGRAYFRRLAAGFGVWAVVSLINLVVDLGYWERDALRVLADFGYSLSYVFVVAALEGRPDDHSPAAAAGRRIPAWYVAVLVAAFFTILVILPELANPAGYRTYYSYFLLYTAMDLYLAARAAYTAAKTPSRKWRVAYGCLSAAFAGMLLTDLWAFWLKRHQLPLESGTLADLAWIAPFVATVLAGASGTLALDDRRRPAEPPTLSDAFAAPPLVWAFFFPFAHFAADDLGWLDPSLAAPRDLLVILFTLVLLSLALRQQLRFEEGLAELVRQRREVASQLRESENDLRLLLQRSAAAEKLRESEERYGKALAASSQMAEPAGEPSRRRDRIAELFEQARLPLRLFAPPAEAPDDGEPFFANGAARAAGAAGVGPAVLGRDGWRLRIGKVAAPAGDGGKAP